MAYCFHTTSSHFQTKDCRYVHSPQGTIAITDCNTKETHTLKVTPLTRKKIESLSKFFSERAWQDKWLKRLTHCVDLHLFGFPWSCYVVRYDRNSPEKKEPVLELAFLQSDPNFPGDLVFKATVFSDEEKTRTFFMLAAWKWIKMELLPKMIKEEVPIPVFDKDQLTAVAPPIFATIRTTFLLGEGIAERTMKNEGFSISDQRHPKVYSIGAIKALELETIQEEESSEEEEKTPSPPSPKQKKSHCCTLL